MLAPPVSRVAGTRSSEMLPGAAQRLAQGNPQGGLGSDRKWRFPMQDADQPAGARCAGLAGAARLLFLGPISHPRQHALPALSADPVICYLPKGDTVQQAGPVVGHSGRLRMLSTFERREEI
jgi:hypothetical protein